MKDKPTPHLLRLIPPRTEQMRLARRIKRHTAWTDSLIQRFRLQLDRMGWRPEKFIFNLYGWRKRLFLRNIQQFRLEKHEWHAAGSIVNNFFPQQRNRESTAFIPSRLIDAAHPHRDRESQHMQSWSLPARYQERELPLKRTLSRYSSQPIAGDGAAATPIFRDSIEVRRRTPRFINGNDEGPGEVAARIVRQVRRVEERPSVHPHGPVLSAPVVRAANEVHEPPQRMRTSEITASGAMETLPTTPSVPPFNVTQLTDEVMRQLDRRLIAARERMGKM